MNSKRVWQDVAGYEGLYKVSNDGRIIGTKSKKQLRYTLQGGYPRVKLYRNAKGKSISVHRIVATTFIPNTENKPQINHKNGIKTDNSVGNLEWATSSENVKHACSMGLLDPSIAWHKHEKAVHQLTMDGQLIKTWVSLSEAARVLGLQVGNISHCCAGKIKSTGGYKWSLEI